MYENRNRQRSRSRLTGIIAGAFLALFCAAGARAQTGAVVGGVVKDAQGGVLPGATVTVRNAESGITRTTVTQGSGDFRVGGFIATGAPELR